MRISHSARNLYLECHFKYFLHYFRKLRPIEDKSAFKFGAAVDSGLNHLLSTRDLQASLDIFHAEWLNTKTGTNISYSKADLEDHLISDVEGSDNMDTKEKSWNSLNRKGHIIIEEYNAQIMPRIKEVIKVQLDDVIKNESGDELVIKTDFICKWEDDRILLVDNKTSSIKYEQDSVRTSTQLATYFEPLREQYKIDACAFIVIPKKINKNKKPAVLIEVIIDTIPEKTIETTFKEFEDALDGIKSAQFAKNESSCISKYGRCPYFNYCHKNDSSGLEEK